MEAEGLNPIVNDEWQCLKFDNSIDFLFTFDSALRNNPEFSLYPWQKEVNEDLCLGRTRIFNEDGTSEIIKEKKPTSKHPYKYALCAANGSGKDAFVIAPFALWFICCKIQSKVIITSSSGNQLSTQTEKYITNLAKCVNVAAIKQFGQEIIKIRKRHYTCLLSGSEIHMFATDEPEKAEGHHPTSPNAEMAIIINEAKSIPKEIFDALVRCTGFNYWLDVSSPGEPFGTFYNHYLTWPNKRRVTYFDCLAHHSAEQFEEDRREYGEHDYLFRSKWLALFTPVGGKYVINQLRFSELIRKNRMDLNNILLPNGPIRVGIDIALSMNGDETVLSFWRGNKQFALETYKIQDGTLLAAAIDRCLKKHKVTQDNKHLFADDGGVGRGVIDMLNKMGWNIARVLNQSKSKNAKLYKNRGAQLWYKFARMIEEHYLIFLNDEKMLMQIRSRKYKESVGGLDVLQLEAKKDMIAAGLPSPDRADASVLAFTNLTLEEFQEEDTEFERKKVEVSQTLDEVIEQIKYNLRRGIKPAGPKVSSKYSLQQALINYG